MKIVVGGVGVISALGSSIDANIAAMREGRSGIAPSPSILRTGNKIPVGEVALTSDELHRRLNIPIDCHLSRTALLGISAVREAMKDARIPQGLRVGIVSATSVGGMDLTENFFRAFMADESRGRLRDVRMHDCGAGTDAIARYCGIEGYRTTVSTACSSAANAIMTGAKLIRHGVADCVVAGGTDALSAFTLNGFKSLMILDEKPCRPFDQSRAGLNLGEGAGYVVLMREEDAADPYCTLAGYANRNDAYHQTASSADGEGAYLAMSDALAVAGIEPSQVGYINVHGTGTPNNDASEGAAMQRLFGRRIPPFSSTKGFTGHTLAAAGGIEAAFSSLAVKYGLLYPNINFKKPIDGRGLVPVCEFAEGQDIKYVLSNSFGFGGNCSSLVFAK